MATTLQIRDVPDDVSRILKERAKAAGQSLSQYALAELSRSARRPTLDVVWAEIREDHPRSRVSVGAAELIRAERDAREGPDA